MSQMKDKYQRIVVTFLFPVTERTEPYHETTLSWFARPNRKNVYLNLIDTKGHCYVHLGYLNMSLQQV